MSKSKIYGRELILDLHRCDLATFNRKSLRNYFEVLCKAIDMEKCKLVFWDDRWTIILNKVLPWRWLWPVKVQTNPKTTGTSAVQFIITSNVTVHTLDIMRTAYVNIFSCRKFDVDKAIATTKSWFGADTLTFTVIERTFVCWP